jgi:hypothetical protein
MACGMVLHLLGESWVWECMQTYCAILKVIGNDNADDVVVHHLQG